jgi:hypothetical protein
MRLLLPCGRESLVDDADASLVAEGRWHSIVRQDGKVYVAGRAGGRHTYLHRWITGAKPGEQVDHANNDGLDNRRSNLRVGTQSQNMANCVNRSGSRSVYRGVSWHASTSSWRAQHQRRHLGLFDTEEAAARAWDTAAYITWGDRARLNFEREVAQ